MHDRIGGFACRLSPAVAIILACHILLLHVPLEARAQPGIVVHQTMPERVQFDEAVPIEIQVDNIGNAAAEHVTVTGLLPPYCELIEAFPTPQRISNSMVWSVGSLAPEARQTMHLRVRLTSGSPSAELRSSVSVTFQTRAANSCAAVVQRPAMNLAVTGPANGVVGESVALQITVANRGNSPARQVSLRTLLPPGLSNPGGNDLENTLGTLAAGESRALTLPVTLTQAGDIRTRIQLCGYGLNGVEREVALHVQEVKVGLSADGPKLLYLDWSSSFELAVRNEGSEVVREAALWACLPPGIAFVAVSDGGCYDSATHTISWKLGDLGPGERRNLLWNGEAREAGELEGRAVLMVGPRAHKQITWKTRVARAEPVPGAAAVSGNKTQPAAAGAGAAPAAEVKPAGWHPKLPGGKVPEMAAVKGSPPAPEISPKAP